ncbi:MAG: hypothetical protein AAF399_07650 [Bacteroidota bacterium]
MLTWHGKRIFFSGDTERAAKSSQLKGIDWAFVPPWLIDDTKAKGITIDADMIGMYHLYPSEIEQAKEEWANEENIMPIATQREVIVLD